MPFLPTDPRASLERDTGTPRATEFAPSQFLPFTDADATTSSAGTRSWFVRHQNGAVVFSLGVPGDALADLGDASERMMALPDRDSVVHIEWGGALATLVGPGIAVVPPGATVIEVMAAGTIVQMFTTAAADVISRSINAASYTQPAPNVAVHQPAASRERGIRTYSLDEHPAAATRFGSIFRSTNLMLNVIHDRVGPRDPSKLSPHSHSDFEQCSIQVSGTFVHHVRTPWTPDSSTWRADEHVEVEGCGAIIFPPPMVHTSQAVGPGLNRLIDGFSPPRADFLSRSGWVLNADEYADDLQRAAT